MSKLDVRKSIFPFGEIKTAIESIEGLRKNVAFDICAGFSITLSKIFKKVYALETDLKIVRELKAKIDEERILNVGIINAEYLPEIDFEINLVLFSHPCKMKSVKKYLEWAKKSDYVVVVEQKLREKLAPPSERTCLGEIIKRRFKFMKEIEMSSCHITIFKPR